MEKPHHTELVFVKSVGLSSALVATGTLLATTGIAIAKGVDLVERSLTTEAREINFPR